MTNVLTIFSPNIHKPTESPFEIHVEGILHANEYDAQLSQRGLPCCRVR